MADNPFDGIASVAEAALSDAAQQLDAARAEQEQLNLLDPLSAEEIEDARAELGIGAGLTTVMREARQRRAGRPKGARNRRTDDFIKYISQFGRDPAVTLMEIQSTSPEELMARSRALGETKGRQMSYADAVSLIVRCAEALQPYMHSKQPVAVDATIRGVVVVEEIGTRRSLATDLGDEPLGVLIEQGLSDE